MPRMKPILFNTEMVRAILDGRKTVTRRVVKPQPKSKLAYACMGDGCGKWGYPGKDAWEYWDDEIFRLHGDISRDELKRRWTPPCHADDILYVRETFWRDDSGEYHYRADDNLVFFERDVGHGLGWMEPKWHPSIHMPKEAARLFLRVKNVWVERLQDIDDRLFLAGIVSEGLQIGDPFDVLWDSTIKPADRDRYGWGANPWVWVIEYERCEKPEELNGPIICYKAAGYVFVKGKVAVFPWYA